MKILTVLCVVLFVAFEAAESSEYSLADAQARLNELGYEAGTADGIMGKATARAIRNFQRVVGLTVSGEFDEKVKLHLFRPCQATMAAPKDGIQGGFQTSFTLRAQGGCHKPESVGDDDSKHEYKVCTRDSGDCSVPGLHGVTDAFVMTLSEPLE